MTETEVVLAASTIVVSQKEPNHAGGRYEGEITIATRQRDGKGKYFYPNPYFTYEGEWLGGEKHGRGRLSFGDGGYYEGEFVNGEITGEGEQRWADGSTYTGQFQDGTRHGVGVQTYVKGKRYEGHWAFNKYSGEGKLTLSNGDTFSGSFFAHKFHGRGRLEQPGLDRLYEGEFSEGHFHGEGELTEKGGSMVYTGQFHSGRKHGQGRGWDAPSGVVYSGEWHEDKQSPPANHWDLGPLHETESYVPASEFLKEEAEAQLEGPKDKGKKGEAKKGAPTEPVADHGPELLLHIGEELPEVAVRIASADGSLVPAESGRRFRVTLFKQIKVVPEDGGEAHIVERHVNFGDRRTSFIDPLDPPLVDPKAKAKAEPKGKASPTPTLPPEEGEEEEQPPDPGQESLDVVIGLQGQGTIGGSPLWLLPVHLQPAIMWLRIEDQTEFGPETFFQQLPPLQIPVRVDVRHEA